jgi:hypothetical protein
MGLGGCLVVGGFLFGKDWQEEIAGLGLAVCLGGYIAFNWSRTGPAQRYEGGSHRGSDGSAFVRCDYCHERVFKGEYDRHVEKHRHRREDGQMAEHATAAPEQRYTASLDDVPQAYAHAKCGVVTRMPEDIIRSYLVNPMMYTDSSFCCGCGKYVFTGELIWEETGEPVVEYMGRLRAAHLRRTFGALPADPPRVFVTPRAAAAFHEVAGQQGLSSYFLSIAAPDTGSEGNYKADLATSWDPGFQNLIESSGVRVVLRQDQMPMLQSIVVDYPGGAQAGFAIGRCCWST